LGFKVHVTIYVGSCDPRAHPPAPSITGAAGVVNTAEESGVNRVPVSGVRLRYLSDVQSAVLFQFPAAVITTGRNNGDSRNSTRRCVSGSAGNNTTTGHWLITRVQC